MLFLGKEDGGQAGEGAGETVYFAAQRGERQTERGERELVPRFNPCDVGVFASGRLFCVFPGFIGKEEEERRQLETSRRERTQSRDCASGTSSTVDAPTPHHTTCPILHIQST